MRKRLKMRRAAGLAQHDKSDHAAEEGEGEEAEAEEGWRGTFKKHRSQGMAQHDASEPAGHVSRNPKEEGTQSALDRASSLMKEVGAIVDGIRTGDKTEAVKAFAHVAILSEKLANRWGGLAEANAKDMPKLARNFAQARAEYAALAEAAASVADDLSTSLHEGVASSISESKLKVDFGDMMSDLMQGLDLYSDINESYEVGTCEGDDCDDDDDDDDADDKDDKKPSFLKKKGGEDDDEKSDKKSKPAKVFNFMKKKKGGDEGEQGEDRDHDPLKDPHYGEQSQDYEEPTRSPS